MKKRYYEISFFNRYPYDTQYEVLMQLLQKARSTKYGKQYKFHEIQEYQDFKKAVPVVTYEDIEPYISRMRQGEENILWPGEVKYFAKSSGTVSSKSKFIPVTTESLKQCHYQGGKDVIALYHKNYEDSRLWFGMGLIIGGSQTVKEYNNKQYYEGDLSAILMDNLPLWAEIYRTPSKEIALMDEWEEKIERMSHEVMDKNVTHISGVPSWTLLILENILKISGKKTIREVWPNIEVYIHGGVNFQPYKDQFQMIIGKDDFRYMEVYNASEGFFAIQDDKGRDDMMLMLDYGIFYEFIPLKDFQRGNFEAIPLEEVKLGVNYAMIISTNGGLWRYIIGDTVMFTSFFPHRIKITGRTKSFINAVGEEVVVENTDKAVSVAARQTGAIVKEYTVAPKYLTDRENATHEWIIEFAKRPADIETFKNILDKTLQELNSDYEAKRYKNLILQPPIIHIAPEGTFYQWLKKNNKLGGQHKVPRLSNDRKILEEILSLFVNR